MAINCSSPTTVKGNVSRGILGEKCQPDARPTAMSRSWHPDPQRKKASRKPVPTGMDKCQEWTCAWNGQGLECTVPGMVFQTSTLTQSVADVMMCPSVLGLAGQTRESQELVIGAQSIASNMKLYAMRCKLAITPNSLPPGTIGNSEMAVA